MTVLRISKTEFRSLLEAIGELEAPLVEIESSLQSVMEVKQVKRLLKGIQIEEQ